MGGFLLPIFFVCAPEVFAAVPLFQKAPGRNVFQLKNKKALLSTGGAFN
jgi:hypothetical protein